MRAGYPAGLDDRTCERSPVRCQWAACSGMWSGRPPNQAC